MKARAGVARELPILFSAAMVLALLAGRKTQTRRIPPRELWDDERSMLLWGQQHFGAPGDVLYVREAWDFLPSGDRHADIVYWANMELRHLAVPEGFNPLVYSYAKKRPSIHMPKWASRIHLARTEPLRVERLQDISEADILAEGISPPDSATLGDRRNWPCEHKKTLGTCPFCSAKEDSAYENAVESAALRAAWARGWDEINGARSPWAENPPLIVIPLGEEARAC
jgi:hypothetical protein